MTDPPFRAPGMSPRWDFLTQSWKLVSPVRPRVMVTSPAFGRPGSFLLTYLPALVLCLSSMTSCSIFSPETSWICLMATPSNSKPNDQPTLVSRSGRPIGHNLLLAVDAGGDMPVEVLLGQGRPTGELGETEDHELSGLDGGDADHTDHHAGIDRLRSVGLVVALHEEGLVGGEPEERALPPFVDEEGGDGAPQLGPQCVVVRLEDRPLSAAEDRLLKVVEEAADVDVAPRRVAGERPGAPYPSAPPGERPDAVDPVGVQQVVLALGDVELEADGAPHHLVRGRLVHAAGVVVAAPDASHVTARGHEHVGPRAGVGDLDPRPVQHGVLGVVACVVDPPLADLLGVEPGR